VIGEHEGPVGQRRERGGGLVFAQTGLRALLARVVRVPGQRVFEVFWVGAERSRGPAAIDAAGRIRAGARPAAGVDQRAGAGTERECR
jgi:hypothetical protein